jgi:hypothetical protein
MSSKARSHNRSGLRSPAFASSMTLFAIACLTFVGAVSGLQGDADHLEGDTEDALALRVEPFAVKVGCHGHLCYSACNFDPLSWGIGVQN